MKFDQLKYPVLLLFMAVGAGWGCAGSTQDLQRATKACGEQLIVEPNGIVREPTAEEKSEQCAPAWKAYNERLDAITKREAAAAAAAANACPFGTTKWCAKRGPRDNRCSCVSNSEVRRELERAWPPPRRRDL